jgi:hypothetical protein
MTEELKRVFVPTHTEISLYLMSLSFVLFAAFNPEIHLFFSGPFVDFLKSEPVATILVAVSVAIGVTASLINPFLRRTIPEGEKMAMVFFAAVVNFFAGYAALSYLAKTVGFSWFLFLPLWNFISATAPLALIIIFKEREWDADTKRWKITNRWIGPQNVSDNQTELREVIFGTSAVAVIFFINEFAIGAHWTITFSTCVAYATTLNELARRLCMPKIESARRVLENGAHTTETTP